MNAAQPLARESVRDRLLYDLFGHSLELRCPDPGIVADLAARESCWKPLLLSGEIPDPDVVVEVVLHAPPGPLRDVQHFSNESFFLHSSSSRLLTGYLRARPWQIHVQSWVEDRETTLDNMILPTLHNVLLRLGLVNVHCSAVARNGQGLLLLGPSGSGKSTTALMLARAGFDFLADNDAYLRRSGEGVEAVSRHRELFLLEESAAVFDDLAFARDLPIRNRGGTEKRVLDMGSADRVHCLDSAPVQAVVFPEVGAGEETEVVRLDPADCLGILMSRVPARGLPALIRDRRALRNQFDVLAALSTGATAWRVVLGRDPQGVVRSLEAVLQGE